MLGIGLDIGGTKIMAGVVDGEGNILSIDESPTQAQSGADVILENCHALIERLLSDYNDINTIGIASAGRIDVLGGIVHYATPNLPDWTGKPLVKLFQERYGIPVAVENDVNAAAVGEYWIGAGAGLNSFMCLTIGTGLGGAFMAEGSIWHGAHWSGAEIGHMILRSGGRTCNCGLKGCAEQYVSGAALLRSYNELSKISAGSAKEVFSRYEEHDSAAVQAVGEFSSGLSDVILSLSNSFDPEAFIIGGGIIDAKHYWWDTVCHHIHKYNDEIKVVPAKLGNKAGIIGAVRLAMDAGRSG